MQQLPQELQPQQQQPPAQAAEAAAADAEEEGQEEADEQQQPGGILGRILSLLRQISQNLKNIEKTNYFLERRQPEKHKQLPKY